MIPVLWKGVALVVGLPACCSCGGGPADRRGAAAHQGFNFVGGMRVIPEFLALVGLGADDLYGLLIAEIVRAGHSARFHADRPKRDLRSDCGAGSCCDFILIPQALRIIVPPLTNQYLNLTKNSSLAVAIGYPTCSRSLPAPPSIKPDRPSEIIAITMAVYLSLSLATSVLMTGTIPVCSRSIGETAMTGTTPIIGLRGAAR